MRRTNIEVTTKGLRSFLLQVLVQYGLLHPLNRPGRAATHNKQKSSSYNLATTTFAAPFGQ
jgi:hypothetical protein